MRLLAVFLLWIGGCSSFSKEVTEENEAALDNQVIGEPKVECEDTMVALNFRTKKPFTGRAYVQGLSDDPRCSRGFADNRNRSHFALMVQIGDCTMQRSRLNGRVEGMLYSLTIVVSFHNTFVTKADKAFRCMCFFRNTKTVTNSVHMAPLGLTTLVKNIYSPSCIYSIHLGSAVGPPVAFGQVGDRIVHVWACPGAAPHHSLLVHSCTVSDGRGNRVNLVDIDGCPVDTSIQPAITYDVATSTAQAEIWGYKFSDTSVLNYECMIELCQKGSGECAGLTPPRCDTTKTASPGSFSFEAPSPSTPPDMELQAVVVPPQDDPLRDPLQYDDAQQMPFMPINNDQFARTRSRRWAESTRSRRWAESRHRTSSQVVEVLATINMRDRGDEEKQTEQQPQVFAALGCAVCLTPFMATMSSLFVGLLASTLMFIAFIYMRRKTYVLNSVPVEKY